MFFGFMIATFLLITVEGPTTKLLDDWAGLTSIVLHLSGFASKSSLMFAFGEWCKACLEYRLDIVFEENGDVMNSNEYFLADCVLTNPLFISF